ncbi:MAG: NAD(P)(+) transhydrogenase (Re/Si-specific) subunit alpha, partial [Hyphomonadaceae bacterium]
MRIAVLRERAPGETRVAATPDTAKKIIALGHQVVVESGAGVASSAPDQQYKDAGAEIAPGAADALKSADLLIKVRRPTEEELAA